MVALYTQGCIFVESIEYDKVAETGGLCIWYSCPVCRTEMEKPYAV